MASERTARPQAVLFACNLNAVRSPMAAGLARQLLGKSVYVASAGVQKGEADPFPPRPRAAASSGSTPIAMSAIS